jgi:hypothetical protein
MSHQAHVAVIVFGMLIGGWGVFALLAWKASREQRRSRRRKDA